MAITANATTLTFNDATTQTTAGLVSGGALGTPSSGALTNCTSIPVNQATGTLPVANGGTGLTTTPTNGQLDIGNGTGFTRATLTQGSGITITNGAGSITIAASGSSGVTSVATGNGLSGGTITSTGTLVVACPAANTVGSYAMMTYGQLGASNPVVYGSNYAIGNSANQLALMNFTGNAGDWTGGGWSANYTTSGVSGTWKWMAAGNTSGAASYGIACRVS